MKSPEVYRSSQTEILININRERLVSNLTETSARLDEWSTGNAKTIDHFLSEINCGESKVLITENKEVKRHVGVVAVEVIYISKQQAIVYGLREDRQEFNDGRTRRRSLSTTLGEKIKPGEEPDEAAQRALKEELDIDTGCFELKEFRSRCEVHESESYPGVTTYCDSYPYIAIIDDEAYNPDGYVEKQADKTKYYVWEIVND